MIQFNPTYFIITIILLIVEIAIALFLHDQFIRPYVGDFLVVILIYCFLKSFIKLRVITAALLVLILSFIIEIAQYANAIDKLGLQNNTMAKIILGSSFSWLDLLAYTLGIITTIAIEKVNLKRVNNF